jgi:hypothetical protein
MVPRRRPVVAMERNSSVVRWPSPRM